MSRQTAKKTRCKEHCLNGFATNPDLKTAPHRHLDGITFPKTQPNRPFNRFRPIAHPLHPNAKRHEFRNAYPYRG